MGKYERLRRECIEKCQNLSWQVELENRLLTEIKRRPESASFSVKDLKWSIEHNRCYVNQKVERFCSASVRKADKILFFPVKAPVFVLEPERILFEDEQILAYNKPPYLSSEDLAVLCAATLVHRLDRDTSGVILLAKTKLAQRQLEQQFRNRVIEKEYLAEAQGVFIKKRGVIAANMAPIHRREGAVVWGISPRGVSSKTEWSVVAQKKKSAIVACHPITGRTHQIRVHLSSIGHPLVGDYTYGYRFDKEEPETFRQRLHASKIAFLHPVTQNKAIINAPGPSDFLLEIF